jgi:hypothetical protein
MLKGNLSTRPFYNERLVSMIVIVGTVIGIALTAFNVAMIYRLSAERTKQRAELERVEAEAAKSRAAAAALQQSVDRPNLLMLASATSEANDLIDQRTFSWTTFFGIVEKTLPLDARLIAVAPRVERGVFMIVMTLNVKRPSDLQAFMDALFSTGTFYDLLPGEQQSIEDGSQTATLSGAYIAPGAPGPVTKQTPARKGVPFP